MTDFSAILEQIVSMEKDLLNEGRPRVVPNFDATAGAEGGSTDASRETAKKVIQELRNLRKVIEKQLKTMDDDLQPMFELVKQQLGQVQKQFTGLMHLTDEQQKHIETMTTLANNRINSLKSTVAELTEKVATSGTKDTEIAGLKKDKAASDKLAADRKDEVDRLTARVTKLDADLKSKETEMETQRVEYDEVLDYYESIMIKMKKAQMEAQRQLRNMEIELGMESTRPKGKPLNESRLPTLNDYFKKKKKIKEEYDW